MEINWDEEDIGKNTYEWTPSPAQEIVDTIDDVDESQKDAQLQRIFFAVAAPSSKRACAERAKGQIKWEIEKQVEAADKGISVLCRTSRELEQKLLLMYLKGSDPFEDKKAAYRMKRPVHYSHLIRGLCFKLTQKKVGEMMTKHPGRSIGLSEKAIRDHRDKSEASLSIPPELEDQTYQVALDLYHKLVETNGLSSYLGNKKKPLK
jgi:hypothetical protein